jgi:HEAT repeat protein
MLLLENEAASVYGRMIAAGFLQRLNDVDARQFLEAQIRSYYRRYNHNAAYVLLCEFAHNPDDLWIQDCLIELLQDERLIDDNGFNEYGDYTLYVEGDEANLRSGLFDKLCANLGFKRCRRAVSALLQWIDSEEAARAISALGDIGDESVAPELIKRLGKGEFLDATIILALGKLHYRPIAPVAIHRLEAGLAVEPPKQDGGEECLNALLQLNAKEAVPTIKAWAANSKIYSRALARRVLAHLENEDPVPALFQLLESEIEVYRKCDLVRDLAATRSRRVLQPLIEIVKGSSQTPLGAAVLWGLGTIGSDESLHALLELSRAGLPKGGPSKRGTLHDIIAESLEAATKQRFHLDFAAWEKWLNEHPGFPEMTK